MIMPNHPTTTNPSMKTSLQGHALLVAEVKSAIDRDQKEELRLLLEKILPQKTSIGWNEYNADNPLAYAAALGKHQLIPILATRYPVNVHNRHRATLFYQAAMRGDHATALAFIASGANIFVGPYDENMAVLPDAIETLVANNQALEFVWQCIDGYYQARELYKHLHSKADLQHFEFESIEQKLFTWAISVRHTIVSMSLLIFNPTRISNFIAKAIEFADKHNDRANSLVYLWRLVHLALDKDFAIEPIVEAVNCLGNINQHPQQRLIDYDPIQHESALTKCFVRALCELLKTQLTTTAKTTDVNKLEYDIFTKILSKTIKMALQSKDTLMFPTLFNRAFQVAVRNNNILLIETIFKHIKNNMRIYRAHNKNNLKTFLRQTLNLPIDQDNNTLLHLTIPTQYKIARWFLTIGADPLMCNQQGEYLLTILIKNHPLETGNWLNSYFRNCDADMVAKIKKTLLTTLQANIGTSDFANLRSGLSCCINPALVNKVIRMETQLNTNEQSPTMRAEITQVDNSNTLTPSHPESPPLSLIVDEDTEQITSEKLKVTDTRRNSHGLFRYRRGVDVVLSAATAAESAQSAQSAQSTHPTTQTPQPHRRLFATMSGITEESQGEDMATQQTGISSGPSS